MNRKLFLLVPTFGLLLIACNPGGNVDGGESTTAPIQEKYETLELSDTNINAFLNTFDNVKELKNFAEVMANTTDITKKVPGPTGQLVDAKNVMTTTMEMGILSNGVYANTKAEAYMKQGKQELNLNLDTKEIVSIGEEIVYTIQAVEEAPEGMGGNGPIAPGNYKFVANTKKCGIPYMEFTKDSFNNGRIEASKNIGGPSFGKEEIRSMFEQAKLEDSKLLNFKFEKSNIGDKRYRFSYEMVENDESSETTTNYSFIFDGGIISNNTMTSTEKDFTLKEDQKTKEYIGTTITTTGVSLVEKADDAVVTSPDYTNFKELHASNSNELMLAGLLPNASTLYYYQGIDHHEPVQPLEFKAGLAEIKATMKSAPLSNVRSHVSENFFFQETVENDPQKYEMTVLHDINLNNNELTNNGIIMVDEQIKDAQGGFVFNNRISSYKEYLYKDGQSYTYASENVAEMFNDGDYEIFTGNATNKKGNYVIKNIDAQTITTNIGKNELLHPEKMWEYEIARLDHHTGEGCHISKRGNIYEINYPGPDVEGGHSQFRIVIVDGILRSISKEYEYNSPEQTTLPNGLQLTGIKHFKQITVFEDARENVKPNISGYTEVKDASATKFNLYNIAMNMM